MALVRSRSTDLFPHGPVPSTTRQLQEALYTHLDDLEKTAFIEALSLYGTRRDIFELVNSLRKTLNTPLKRQLFPLVRQVIRKGDVDSFDLLTRGDKQHNTMPRPHLYRPHMADLNVMKKQRASTMSRPPRKDSMQMSSGSECLPSSKSSYSTAKRSLRTSRSRSPRSRSQRRYEDDVTSMATPKNQTSAIEQEGEYIELDLGTPGEDRSGYGFVIRGGHESGLGVYVSSVDHGSTAHRCGLQLGDLIVEANNINFENISHDEAALLIQAATCLQLVVSRVGNIPGSRTIHEAYRWTDPMGRPVSPPGGWDPHGTSDGFLADDEGRTRSGSLMLKGSDERKVNVVVERGHGLGLMVRGGREYRLGVFVSAIDSYSVAENSGLKVGDQILDVNGRSLLDVTHAQAVRLLKSARHLMMTVKDVGKIPFAKTTIDQTGWIESTRVNSYARSVSSRRSESESPDSSIFEGFKRGAGSKLMPTSLTTGQQQKELIYDQAKLLLNDSEQMTLSYYVSEYEKRTINLTGFTQALHRILNTPAKLTLLSEIRTIILPKELNAFDQIVLNRELDNSLSEARGRLAPDVISIGSYDSHDVRPQARRTMFSQANLPLEKTHRMEIMDQMGGYNLRETSRRMGGSASSLTKAAKTKPSRRTRSPSPVSAYQMMVSESSGHPQKAIETIPRMTKGNAYKKAEEPSDDSGVEINGQLQSSSPEYHHTLGAKSKVNTNKRYSSPQKKILSQLQSANRNEGKHVLVHREISNTLPRRQQKHQIQHRALVHKEFQTDHDSVTGSVEEIRFLSSTDDDIEKEKGRISQKGRPTPLRQLHERSRSLQRGGQRSEGRPKSRARSSDPVLTRGGRARHETTEERDVDSSRGREVARAIEDVYATVNKRRTGRSKSPSMNTANRTRTPKGGRGLPHQSPSQRYDAKNLNTLQSSSGSTMVNSNAHSSSNANGRSSTSTVKVSGEGPAAVTTVSHERGRSRDIHRKRAVSHYNQFGQLLTVPSASVSPPLLTTRKKQPQQKEQDEYQLPSPNVIQKLGKTYRSVSPRKPHRSPKISAHSVTNRKRLVDNEFFRPKKETQEEDGDEEFRSSYPNSSVESTPRGNIRPHSFYPHKAEMRSNLESKSNTLNSNISRRKENEQLTLDKNGKSSKVSVPLIKINSKVLPKVDAAFMKSSFRSNKRQTNSLEERFDKAADSVTISDTPIEIKDRGNSLNSNSFVSDQSNYSHRSNNINGVNSSSIIIYKPATGAPRPTIEAIKERAAERYGDIPLEIIYIYRSKPTLGVAIEGGANTRQPLPKVINVQPGGSAYESGGLKVGHVILEVNGKPAVGLSHLDAARLIAEAFKDKDKNRMELLVTTWFDELLDVIKVDVGFLKVITK